MRSGSKAETRVVITAVALFVASIAAGCRQIADITARAVAPACGADAYVDTACGSCSDLACCAELTACAGEPLCARAQTCLAHCHKGDRACRDACAAEHGAGFDATLASVLACQTRACSAECDAECGAAPEPATRCDACLKERCCEPSRACASDAACLTRRFRRAHCAESTCRDLSDLRNPDGIVADDAVMSCRRSSCLGECAAWECVGAPVPRPTSGATVTIAVVDSLTPTPVQGLQIRTCNRAGYDCALAGQMITTNGAGIGRFEVSVDDGGFDGYFEITDPVGGRVPLLFFPWPPITSDRVVTAPSFTLRARNDLLFGLGLDLGVQSAFVLARPLDCARNEGAGVRFELDPPPERAPIAFYLDRRLPVVAATTTTTDDTIAFGGFADVPQGNLKMRGRSSGADRLLFEVGVHVQKGTMTFVEFAPPPRAAP